jgi:cytoskeleton protein RodZ
MAAVTNRRSDRPAPSATSRQTPPDRPETLRETRVRRQIDVADAAGELNFDPKYVRAIEWERFDLLPSSRDGREYLRSYAELLGLDPQPYVERYDSAFAQERSRAPARRRRRVALTIAVSAAALAVIAAWQFLPDDSKQAQPPAPVSPIPARPPAEVAKPPPTTPPARRRPSVTRRKALRPAKVAVVAARGDSWIEARAGDAGGALLYRGNLARGRSIRLRARRVWMRLGAASNVDVTLNGRRVGRSLFGTVDVTFTSRSR